MAGFRVVVAIPMLFIGFTIIAVELAKHAIEQLTDRNR
jgi:hypothetical protein